MFLRQIYDPALAHYSYLIACQRSGEAVVIDPSRDIDRYHQIARANDLRITAAADTHIHADYLTGTREFSADPQVTVYLSAEGGEDWQYEWAGGLPNAELLNDGDAFMIGAIEFHVAATPGHTPEHIALVVIDRGGGASTPVGICSGDFMFVGDVGRPDLLESAAGQAGAMKPAARALFNSLKAFAKTSDEIQIWPAHGAGSPCGKALGAVPTTTAGYEKRYNTAYRVATDDGEDAFIDFILADQPEPPTYWARMKRWNRGGFPLLGQPPSPARLTAAEIGSAMKQEGTVLIDTRPDRAAFMESHLRGAIFAPAGDSFPTILGTYVEPERNIVLLVDDARNVEALVRMAVRIGIDHIAGYAIADDVLADSAVSDSLSSIDRHSTAALDQLLKGDPGRELIDVRSATEFRDQRVAGATHIAHTRLPAQLNELPEGPLALHCGSGGRAASASSYLAHLGRDVIHVDGFFSDIPKPITTSDALLSDER